MAECAGNEAAIRVVLGDLKYDFAHGFSMAEGEVMGKLIVDQVRQSPRMKRFCSSYGPAKVGTSWRPAKLPASACNAEARNDVMLWLYRTRKSRPQCRSVNVLKTSKRASPSWTVRHSGFCWELPTSDSPFGLGLSGEPVFAIHTSALFVVAGNRRDALTSAGVPVSAKA
jgi:transposase